VTACRPRRGVLLDAHDNYWAWDHTHSLAAGAPILLTRLIHLAPPADNAAPRR
jgi:hypothetical protein